MKESLKSVTVVIYFGFAYSADFAGIGKKKGIEESGVECVEIAIMKFIT